MLAAFLGGGSWLAMADEPSPLELFEQRIVPIFKSPNPSSCVQCHLASVDLKDYILPSSRETFLSLRDQGLIDLDHPERSKILHLIAMGEQDSDALARRIHAKTRQAEYEAFAAWIRACCADPNLRSAPALEAANRAGPRVDMTVIRHNRKDRILDSFVRNIWSQRMRCFPCHTPAEIDPSNPAHEVPARRHAELVAQHGARMNIFQATPQETLRRLVANSRKPRADRLPLINVNDPLQSLLLLKPISRVPGKDAEGNLLPPSHVPPVTHGGGIKMHKNDQSYKAFVQWLQDYARGVQDGYRSAADLPADDWVPTEQVLRIAQTPVTWPAMSIVQVFVHPADQPPDSPPVAFTQGVVTPRRMFNGALFLIAPGGSDSGATPRLAPGTYRLRVFIDHQHRLDADPTALLHHAQDPDAETVITAKWEEGFKHAEVVPGSQFSTR
ncbi:MAG: hypothetical protein D6753_18320 [Planctomycetota bacterium]|nr:MAG: hypothetical protein D6753_18320 [Planctomycetota bacterium]